MMCGVNSTRRMVWALVLGVIVALGLASRRFAAELPPLIAKYAGDTSYACAMFALVALMQAVFALIEWLVERRCGLCR